MTTDIGFLILIIVLVIVVGAIIGIVTNEKNESNDFWECIQNDGSVDWCINQFEYDAQDIIDKFYSCMDEIGKLEYCHTKFLR